ARDDRADAERKHTERQIRRVEQSHDTRPGDSRRDIERQQLGKHRRLARRGRRHLRRRNVRRRHVWRRRTLTKKGRLRVSSRPFVRIMECASYSVFAFAPFALPFARSPAPLTLPLARSMSALVSLPLASSFSAFASPFVSCISPLASPFSRSILAFVSPAYPSETMPRNRPSAKATRMILRIIPPWYRTTDSALYSEAAPKCD